MSRRGWIVALIAVLVGCAGHERAQQVPVAVNVSPQTWQQVDVDLVLASQEATRQAEEYARGAMDHWRTRVYQQTDEKFLPWYNSYWTQEWLSVKVGWYKLNERGEADPSARRLAVYLQDQYQRRVLVPVAVEIDPEAILEQSTQFYVELMGRQAQAIAQRHGVPSAQLDRHLQAIPAITLGPPSARNASLYQLLQAHPLNTLPAYAALAERARTAGGAISDEPGAGISAVARQTREDLEAQFAGRGVAGAVAAAVGRVAGAMISVGMVGIRAMSHESDRPNTDAQIRKSLGEAFDQAWLKSMNSPGTGVMAGVYYLSGQIEGNLAITAREPVSREISGP
ncbi:hypothetical protein [Pseudomonas gingeri]|uniref:hypothetical protein n=1 Tax=Pseudomonas gingeri TaxID=117681 RepID=UPI0015A37B6B|nr:hypothetical protein [Pseudomonas gingeri]NWA15437.1 hypothetical protein [Pseudomonas gingeri]NWA56664.1 hypothetical protein [Pseudomonas gingeri]NWA95158.1 hypothetical protein [Pseudomonas gingeri]NWB05240.1 hypothetical protein [Pseudomonas gingeri]